jgi:glycosyltransferase involved in cell wall biosynthesis
MSNLRVAITAEQLMRPTPGGIGTYTEQLLRAYKRVFGAPVVLTSKPSARKSRVALAELGDSRPTPFGMHITGRLWERGLLKLPKSLADFDVVHATSFHYPDVHIGATRPCLSVFVHDIAWKHHPEFFSPRGRAFHDRALDRTARLADWILVPSERTKADLVEHAGIVGERIRVVGEGADHLPAPNPQRLKPAKPYLLTVSTLEPRKNLPGLLRAYEVARKQIGLSCPDLLVVGPKGWTGEANHASTQAPVPTAGVEFVGAVSDQRLADLYADAVGFAYVPHLEGFGLPPLEAMRAGIAVVASDAVPSVIPSVIPKIVPGVADAVTSPAIIVTRDDTAVLAEALQRLVEDAVFRNEYARRGQQFAEGFRWDDVARRHHDVWSAND